ncbi:hypothetical protein KN1_28440 [Stygiolobus caldivivus]|uniref:HTH bat-type domain-containing protein n=1 Tax=Stygiolobus caldivivus TaxID=2824673 RepID=A0A8D5U966_9CREN|nr:hypothetical protein KN1_28440 [Stygiolobus caldivivus]
METTLILFEIEHDDCWSKLTSDHSVTIRTVFAKPKRNEYILGIDEIKVAKSKDFKDFLRAFKKDKSVLGITNVSEVDKKRGIYRITFKEKFDHMLMSALNNYTVFYFKDLIRKGKERLIVVTPSDEVGSLKEELESLGKITLFRSSYISLDSLIPTFFDLSEQELHSLTEAISRGYYNFPRRINLDELGNILELSKPTIEEYIRKAEKKIMMKYYNEICQLDLLAKNID